MNALYYKRINWIILSVFLIIKINSYAGKFGLVLRPTYLPKSAIVVYSGFTATVLINENYHSLKWYLWLINLKKGDVELITFPSNYCIKPYEYELSVTENNDQIIFSYSHDETTTQGLCVLELKSRNFIFLHLPINFFIIDNPRFLDQHSILFSGLINNEKLRKKFEMHSYFDISDLFLYDLKANKVSIIAEAVFADFVVTKDKKIFYLKIDDSGYDFPRTYKLFSYETKNGKIRKVDKFRFGYRPYIILSPDEDKLLMYNLKDYIENGVIYDLRTRRKDSVNFPDFEFLRWGTNSDTLVGIKRVNETRKICLINLKHKNISEISEGTAPTMINEKEIIYAKYNKDLKNSYAWEFFLINTLTGEKKRFINPYF